MAAAIVAVDELIREYLLYRGFVQTLKTLEQEKKEDKEKGLRVNRIVDYIFTCINKSDFGALQAFWNHLSKKFFSRLNQELMNNAHKLESTVLRLFLINAHRNGRHEEVKIFFERISGVMQDRRDWKEWFALPYIRNPEQHPTFKMYYSKEWYDTFVVSLYNFFSIMMAGLPLPTLLQFETEHQKIQQLVTEKNLLHSQLATTKDALLEAEATVQRLEARLAQNVAAMSAENKINKTSATRLSGGGGGAKASQQQRRRDQKAKSPTYTSPEELGLDKSKDGTEESKAPYTLTPNGTNITVSTTTGSNTASNDTVNNTVTTGGTVAGSKGGKGIDTAGPFLVIDEHSYKDHLAPVAQCKFSPNGVHVASVDVDNGLRVWVPTGNLVTKSSSKYKMDLLSLDWVHHGAVADNFLMLGFGKGQVKLFDAISSNALWEFSVNRNYPRILSVACSSSSPSFAVSAAGWHSQSALGVGGGGGGGGSGSKVTAGLTSPTLPSSLSMSSEMLVMSYRSTSFSDALFDPTPGELSIWDMNQKKVQTVLPLTPAIAVNCMAFNHNSNLLVTGGVDGMIRLFDVQQGECLCGWTAHHGEVLNVQFSSDENSVYSLGQDNNFCQWSTLRSTEKLAHYNIHENASKPTSGWDGYFPTTPPGNLFAFESDDKYVLTCSPSGSIFYQMNGSDGSLSHVLSLSDHNGPVTCVDWLPDRRSYSTCITGSVDSTIRVVNLLKT